MLLGLFSVIIGVIIGASGVGGVLLIPALAFLGPASIHEAMASALFSFFFTGVIATWAFQRHGSICWKTAVPVCAGSLLTSYAGAYVNAYTDAFTLNLVLSGIIIITSAYALRPLKTFNLAESLGAGGKLRLLVGLGLGVGFLCGLTGIGGGLVSIPIMLVLGFNPLASIATGQVLQLVVAISGSVSNISNGFVRFELIWWVTLLEVAGVFAGVRLAHAIPVNHLKLSVSLLCLALGIFMLVRTFV